MGTGGNIMPKGLSFKTTFLFTVIALATIYNAPDRSATFASNQVDLHSLVMTAQYYMQKIIS